MENPLIHIQDVTKEYKTGEVTTTVLRGVSLEIKQGEFVAIMGQSGSGKSTLMHILGFLDRITGGSYLFRGRDVSKLAGEELSVMRRTEVGFIFQAFNLLPNSTVISNVILPMLYADVPAKERRARAEKALASVGLSHRLDHKSNQLSGGEKQRVAIARALVNEPALLFADEPTGNLDTKSGEEVLQIFRTLHEEGRTIIMVTHELEAAEFAERIVRVRDGRILSDDRTHIRRTSGYGK